MNLLNDVPSFFGNVTVASLGPQDYTRNAKNTSPIEYRLTYINNLSENVTIGWRNGLKFVLPPMHEFGKSELIARVDLYIQPHIVPDVQRLVSKVNDASSFELKALRDAFASNLRSNTYQGAKITLDYPISMQKLKELGGSIYYYELDCIISLKSPAYAPAHPYSEDGRDLTIVDAHSERLSDLGFGYSVELIDNKEEYGDRYLNIGRKVYPIRAQKDATRRSGIYVLSNHSVTGALGPEGRDIKYYPFEGAEESLGIFKTFELAASYGDISTVNKQELADKQHQLEKQRLEAKEIEHNHKTELLNKEREKTLLEMERDMSDRLLEEARATHEQALKLERDRLKDFFERRMYDRKDSHEIIKLLPALIIGISAIFMALKTFGVEKAPKGPVKGFT